MIGAAMKKIFLIALTAVVLTAALASCSRRNQYEDQLESQKEAESLDAIPETNGNIMGENAPDYQTPIMLKTGNTPFYKDKKLEDLKAVYRNTGKTDISIIPTGRMFCNQNYTKQYFYNKLTGNFSAWCSDPLCDGSDCIWKSSILYIQYVSDDHLYFLASVNESGNEYGVFRCDFQRNHIEKIIDVPFYSFPRPDRDGDGKPDGYEGFMDEVEVVFEDNDQVYYLQSHYEQNNEDAISSLYTLNLSTMEKHNISGDIDLVEVTVIGESIYYTTTQDRNILFKADLDFSNPELFQKNVYIGQYNDQYMIIEDRNTVSRYAYNLENGQTYAINDIYGEVYLSGNYLYYTRNLTEKEIADDPLKDYYTFTWEEESPRPNGKPVQRESNTQGAGKIYRVRIDQEKAPEECVFQLTFKDVPIRIKSIEMDGEVIYISFHNQDGFKNYYNQTFAGDENQTICYGLVDLQNGSVTILELPNEE